MSAARFSLSQSSCFCICFIQRNLYPPRLYDYVLVADKVEDMEDQIFKKQDAFICEMKQKNIKVTVCYVTVTHISDVSFWYIFF